MSNKSSSTWTVVHIIFPLIPFCLESLIRYFVLKDKLPLLFFSSATLSISIGLICLFVAQCLSSHKTIIPNDEELKESLIKNSYYFYILAIIFFGLFGIAVFSSALIERNETQMTIMVSIKDNIDLSILILSIIPILYSFFVQESFKLKAII